MGRGGGGALLAERLRKDVRRGLPLVSRLWRGLVEYSASAEGEEERKFDEAGGEGGRPREVAGVSSGPRGTLGLFLYRTTKRKPGGGSQPNWAAENLTNATRRTERRGRTMCRIL